MLLPFTAPVSCIRQHHAVRRSVSSETACSGWGPDSICDLRQATYLSEAPFLHLWSDDDTSFYLLELNTNMLSIASSIKSSVNIGCYYCYSHPSSMPLSNSSSCHHHHHPSFSRPHALPPTVSAAGAVGARPGHAFSALLSPGLFPMSLSHSSPW